jgi:hypothetical protein
MPIENNWCECMGVWVYGYTIHYTAVAARRLKVLADGGAGREEEGACVGGDGGGICVGGDGGGICVGSDGGGICVGSEVWVPFEVWVSVSFAELLPRDEPRGVPRDEPRGVPRDEPRGGCANKLLGVRRTNTSTPRSWCGWVVVGPVVPMEQEVGDDQCERRPRQVCVCKAGGRVWGCVWVRGGKGGISRV